MKLCMLMMLALAACAHDPPVKRYELRGQIVSIEGSGDDLSLTIHHERVPAFTGRDGKVSEMGSMKMIFGIAKDVPRAALQQGTKLQFAFDVRWSEAPALLIVQAHALPADTPLTLTDER
jgi:hypothetical protein